MSSNLITDPTGPPALEDSSVQAGMTLARPRVVARRLLHHRSGAVGLAVLVSLSLFSVVGPFLFPYSPVKQHLADSLISPSAQHWLGTDPLGRDIVTRLAYGGRYSLSIGVFAVAVGLLIGVPVGAVSGYWGGWVDLVIQRVTDAVLAFPGILLALALVAGLGVGIVNVVIAVGISSVPGFVRLVRASVLSARELAYVEAARSIGVPEALILWRHALPNAITPAVVQATTQLGAAILVAAGLGFLGLGVPPPTPEWGNMLSEARNYIFRDAVVVAAPGVAIAVTVLAFNLIGDGLRDALDPRMS